MPNRACARDHGARGQIAAGAREDHARERDRGTGHRVRDDPRGADAGPRRPRTPQRDGESPPTRLRGMPGVPARAARDEPAAGGTGAHARPARGPRQGAGLRRRRWRRLGGGRRGRRRRWRARLHGRLDRWPRRDADRSRPGERRWRGRDPERGRDALAVVWRPGRRDLEPSAERPVCGGADHTTVRRPARSLPEADDGHADGRLDHIHFR